MWFRDVPFFLLEIVNLAKKMADFYARISEKTVLRVLLKDFFARISRR